MDSPRDNREQAAADQPVSATQAELEALLDADEADVAAGRISPAEPVLARMRATADRIRQERAKKEATANRTA